MIRYLLDWFKRLISGHPHFVIGGADPYMLRWFIIPRNPWFNVYLHKFLRDDEDRALHDHPWNFLSIMIHGGYVEILPQNGIIANTKAVERKAPSIAYRRATDKHRVILFRENTQPVPCWTIVFTGPKLREWGFWCPKGFVNWKDFVDQNDSGNVGKGCGE